MNRILWIALCAAFAAAPSLVADEPKKDECDCPVAKQVQTLLASWKDAAEAAKNTDEATSKDLAAKCSALCKECPIGSRIGATVGAFKETLAALIAADEAGAKSCPIEAKAKEGGPAGEACKAALALKTARSQFIKDLHALATCVTASCSACCPANASAEIATETGKTPPDLSTTLAALEASWKKAGGELAALAPEKQKALGEGVAELSKASKGFALVMPSLIALADGFDALNAIHGKMNEWLKANAAAIGELPAEARAGFEHQQKLALDASKVGAIVRETLKSCSGEKPAENAPAK